MFTSQQSAGVADYQVISKLIQEKTFDKLIEDVEIQKGFKIIDIGCGTGNNSFKLSKLVGDQGKVVATDPIKERIEKSKAIYSGNSSNLQFNVALGSESSKFGTDFDLAVSSTVLHWIPDDQKLATLQGIYDSLANGSQFVFNTVKIPSLNLGPIVRRLSTNDNIMNNIHAITQDKWFSLAKQAGFSQVEIKESHVSIPIPSIDHFYRWYACSIHVEDYEATLKELRELEVTDDELAALHNEQGQVVYKQTYFNGYCKK